MATTEETGISMKLPKRQSRSGSPAAAGLADDFDSLYRRYLKPVYAYVCYRVDGRATAEDVTAQIFEKAWRGFAEFDPRRSEASTWLFTIARNCLTDHYRSQARKPAVVELDREAGAGAPTDPEPMLEALQLRQELREALLELDAHEREIVALKFGAVITNREISRLLEITETNVGTILYRALRKLKTRLEGGMKND